MGFDAGINLLMVLNECINMTKFYKIMCIQNKSYENKNYEIKWKYGQAKWVSEQFFSSVVVVIAIVKAFINMLLFGGCWWKGKESIFVCYIVIVISFQLM